MQPRNWLFEHFPAICAAPKVVTQIARSASPSWLRSIRAQASPVLPPDQVTSSICHRRESVVEELEHVGPGSQSPLTSFWPGWSSGPCPSLMQRARTGAAARRPSTSVAAASPHIPTTLSVAPVAAPQPDRSPADFAVLLEFVISSLLYSDCAASTSASLGRPMPMTGPFFPGGSERDVRGARASRAAGATASAMPRAPAEAREKSAAGADVKLADMHDVMASCAHVTGSSEATMHAIACRTAFDTASARLAAGRATMSAGRPGASKDASRYSSRQSTKWWSSSLSSLNVA